MHYTRIGQHTVNAVRLAEVLQVLARHGFADLLRRAGFQDGLPARVLRGLNLMAAPEGEPATLGSRIRDALTELGPTFVKFGQILSTRPDLIGHVIAEELALLQDKVTPIPFEGIAPLIEEAIGGPLEGVFHKFEQEPVASASLGQVYRAELRPGEAVAVKVQRPGVERIIESDLSLMRQLAEWVSNVEDAKWLNPPGIVDEFARSIRRELDFEIEAAVIERFRQNFEGEDHVLIPRVYRELSSQRLLVMTWVDGVRVDRLDEYPARNSDPKTVSVWGCEVLCRMVFEHHLFHADPHPGNVFLTRDNTIAFLDLGMAGHLEKTDVAAIADLIYAIFQEDAHECVNAVLTLTADSDQVDREALANQLAEFIAFEARTIIGGGQIAKGLERAIQILRRAGLELAPRFSLLLKALATIEIVGRSLDPKMDMVPVIQPYIERIILARFQPLEMVKLAQQNTTALLKLSRQLPGDLSQLLHQLRRGRLKIQVHHEHLDNLAATIDRSSSRNTVGMIVAALIVGSSLLITVESKISHIGIAGYVAAGLLGTVLVLNILWSRKF